MTLVSLDRTLSSGLLKQDGPAITLTKNKTSFLKQDGEKLFTEKKENPLADIVYVGTTTLNKKLELRTTSGSLITSFTNAGGALSGLSDRNITVLDIKSYAGVAFILFYTKVAEIATYLYAYNTITQESSGLYPISLDRKINVKDEIDGCIDLRSDNVLRVYLKFKKDTDLESSMDLVDFKYPEKIIHHAITMDVHPSGSSNRRIRFGRVLLIASIFVAILYLRK